MKSAYYDPNPCIMLEHKGLYWSKIKGTEGAMTIDPDEEYVIPFGKGRVVENASEENIKDGKSIAIITYGMGVYWATNAVKNFNNQVEIIDIRTISPLDEKLIIETVNKHGKCIVLTEEPKGNGFANSIASMISTQCFEKLDAPVQVIGAENLPAIPLNSILEMAMLPNAKKVGVAIQELLDY
jgi:2-oxoisovalerate dehydrogenase E1 component